MKELNWRARVLLALGIGTVYSIILISFYEITGETNFTRLLFQIIFFTIFIGLGLPFILEKLAPKLLSKVKTPDLFDNEKIIFEDGANLFRGKWIAVGGKLFLTEERLIFNSHKYNFQNGQTSIDLRSIKEINEKKTSGIIDNGMRIITKDNSKFDFVVNGRNEWVNLIRKKVQNDIK